MAKTELELQAEYVKYAHGVQTALAYSQDAKCMEPKHLRVGVDMSKADMAGLATLLIEKGVFTKAEYLEAIVKSAHDEMMRQRDALASQMGMDPDQITLL